MSIKRCRLIVNPISGTRTKDGLADAVAVRLGSGWEVETRLTEGPDHATRLAAEAAAEGFDAVVAAGGDGTVNETARALTSSPVALGIIPCGSGNGLARHLNIPVDSVRSLDIIADGNILTVDTGMVNDRPFFCTCGVGFDAAVSDAFARKKRRGLISYFQAAIETFRGYRPGVYSIETPEGVITREALLVAVCNASQYGNNAYIAPQATMLDGMFDILVVHAGSPLSAMRLGLDMMIGTMGRNAAVDMVRAASLRIRRQTDDVAHVDGEPVAGLGCSLDINCRPASLRVFAPRNIPRFRPVITPIHAFARDMKLTFDNFFGF